MNMVEKKSGTFKSFDGTEIYYEVRGQGEPLIFVYGIACLMNHWHYQIDYFAKKYQVITFDLRGHHKSEYPKDPKNANIESVATDITYLVRELGLKKAHFVGHSFGAPVLLKVHNEAPGIFASLTLINGFSKNPIKGMFGLDVVEPLFHFVKAQFKANPEVLKKIWKTVDNPISSLFTMLVGGFNIRLTKFKDVEIYMRGVSHIPFEIFLLFFEDMMSFDGASYLKKLKTPCLLIAGDRDGVTPLRFQHELHDNISGSELVIVPYGSHCTQLDFPDYVNLKVESFFLSLKRPAAIASDL